MGEVGLGVLQANSDYNEPEELALLRRMAEISGRPVSFSLLQVDHAPGRWKDLLAGVHDAVAAGVQMRGQVGARPIGILMGLQASIHPFSGHRAFKELLSRSDGRSGRGPRDHADLVAALRDPAVRGRILGEDQQGGFADWMRHALTQTFELGDPPDYEPDPADSVAARAGREGRTPLELAYDLLLADDGRALLYYPFENYSDGDLEAVRTMLADDHTVAGLSDGGAHVATICDASFPTFLLTHWARDRRRGERLPLELVVRKQTRDTAAAVGIHDRGVVAPGMRADLNVVDFDGLRLRPPEMVFDLPTGGKRLVQRATGYRHTFVAGVETYADGQWTGATPGRLVRGARTSG
jgi:N-acyl-D-aspartate/D-glutamate deacylase